MRHRTTIEDLRLAIDCLPRATRIAMLEGIRTNRIVVGAYSHGDGICPMLAAHRAGGRTSLISFARAWDRFALGSRAGWAPGKARPRPATRRELLVLCSHIEASLLAEEVPDAELAAAITEHEELLRRRRDRSRRERPRPGDPNRAVELSAAPGWAWTRVVRRYDDYQRVLECLGEERCQTAAGGPAADRFADRPVCRA